MTKKGHKIEKGRIEDLCKDLKRIKTFQGLRKFLINELELTQDCINSADIEHLDFEMDKMRKEIHETLNRKWDEKYSK